MLSFSEKRRQRTFSNTHNLALRMNEMSELCFVICLYQGLLGFYHTVKAIVLLRLVYIFRY